MRELRHENVNAFVGYFSDPMRPSLIMEYCQRQSLEVLIEYSVNSWYSGLTPIDTEPIQQRLAIS